MESLSSCPTCGQPEALLALGVRYDHPYRWRPWITMLAQLYLCDRCEALLEVGMAQTPHHGRGHAARAGQPRAVLGAVA